MRASVALTSLGKLELAERARVSSVNASTAQPRWRLALDDGRLALWAHESCARLTPLDAAPNAASYPLSIGPNGAVIVRRPPCAGNVLYYWIRSNTVEIDEDLERLVDAKEPIQLDRKSLLHFIWRGRPLPGGSLYSGIHSLGVGEELVCSLGARPVVRRYWWPLHFEPLPTDEGALRSEALERIGAAVVRSTAGSHRTGKFGASGAIPALLLSGGVDSSLIAALARRHDVPLVTYTVAFNDTYGLNETAFASRVARSLRLPHRVVRVGVENAARLMKGVLAAPYPSAAAAAITNAALIEAIVVDGPSYLLSGLGADECFGGFHKPLEHLAAQLHHMRKRGMDLAGLLDLPLPRLLRMREALFLGVAEFFTLRRLSQLANDDTIMREFPVADQTFYRCALLIKPDAHPLELMAAHEYQYRVSEQLLPALRGGLGAAPTAYPFLDPTVYLWASALDPSHCYWHEDGAWWAKRLLREVAKELLPAEIVMRKRQVLLAPMAHWLLTKSLRAVIIEEIADSAFWKLGVLRHAVRDQLLTKLRRYHALDPSSAWQEQLWVVLSLCAWVNRRTQP